MKIYVFAFCLFIATSAFGQTLNNNDNKENNLKKFQIGFNISPDICYRTIEGNASIPMLKELRNGEEVPKISYTTSVNISYTIKKNFSIETGIQYSNKGYQTKDIEFTFPDPDPAVPEKVKTIYNYHYLAIPLRSNFIFGENKIRFIASVGVEVEFLINESQTSILYFPNNTTRIIESIGSEYRKVNLSPFLSLGADYKINDKMNLRLQPIFRYGVLKTSDTPLTDLLYSVGLNIGLYVRI
jgi:Outer membrane protein beta-barrel domain